MPMFPARVHPILARKANTAVIIRRGPSKSVCTLLWDRSNYTFKLCQWLRGRIYDRRCDLSPDGKHFIYFAMNGKWGGPVKGLWTATRGLGAALGACVFPGSETELPP